MKELKLTLPPENFTLDDAFKVKWDKKSFAGVVTECMLEKGKKFSYTYNKNHTKLQRAETASREINQHFDKVREAMDARAMEYLWEHDGVIDSWPDCTALDEMGCGDLNAVELVFDYFGDDYKVSNNCKDYPIILRKTDGFVYRNTYKATDTPAYTKAQVEKKRLLEMVDSEGKETSYVISALYLIGAVYLSFALLSVLGDMFFGIGKTLVEPLYSAWGLDEPGEGGAYALRQIAYILLGAPAYLHTMWKESMAGADSQKIYWIITIAALLAAGLGAVVCGIFFANQHSHNKSYKKKKAEYRRFLKSEDYQNTLKEDAAWKKTCENLSEEWHRAWFDWIQNHKKKVGLTHMEQILDRETQAEIEHVRTTIREAFHVEIPPHIDPRDWVRRYERETEKYLKDYAENGETEVEELPAQIRAKIWRMGLEDMKKAGMILEAEKSGKE